MVSVTVVTVVFETLGFSTYMIMSSANGGNLTSSFLVLMHFISSSCPSPLALTFSAMLNKRGACGHFCLLPDIRAKAFSFSLLSNMFAVIFSYVLLLCWGAILLYPICWEFLSWKNVEYCQILFCVYWDDHEFFPVLSMQCIMLIDLCYFAPSLHSMNKSHLIME